MGAGNLLPVTMYFFHSSVQALAEKQMFPYCVCLFHTHTGQNYSEVKHEISLLLCSSWFSIQGWCMRAQLLSHVSLATPRTIVRQAPPSMGFSRQEYWSGLPGPPSGDLPDPGIEPASPALAGGFFYHGVT